MVHRPDDFYIGIEIDAAVTVKDQETGIVADESPLSRCGSLAGVADGVDVEVAFVPASDLIAGEVAFPRVYAAEGARRQRAASEPAVVDCTGYRHRYRTVYDVSREIQMSETSLRAAARSEKSVAERLRATPAMRSGEEVSRASPAAKASLDCGRMNPSVPSQT